MQPIIITSVLKNCYIKFITKDEKYKTIAFRMKQMWMNYYWIMSFCQQHKHCSQILNHQLHYFLLSRQFFKSVSFLTSRSRIVSIVQLLGILLYYYASYATKILRRNPFCFIISLILVLLDVLQHVKTHWLYI